MKLPQLKLSMLFLAFHKLDYKLVVEPKML